MEIHYKINQPITVELFVKLLQATTLGERRPLHDLQCLQGMLEQASLTVTAWKAQELVGIARSVTDFHYACYLSDLAVHEAYQRRNIGKQLIDLTQQQLGKHCKLILLAAPLAHAYYEPLNFVHHPRCWVLDRDQSVFKN